MKKFTASVLALALVLSVSLAFAAGNGRGNAVFGGAAQTNASNGLSLAKAADRLKDLVDDIEDARTDEEKTAIQTAINAIVSQYGELADYALDYTSMTKQQLEAIEDKLDILEDEYEKAEKNGAGSNNMPQNNMPQNNMPQNNVPQNNMPLGTLNSKLVDRLKDLVDDMEDARTDEEKTAIQTAINAIVSQYDELADYALDYTSMTKQQLEEIEDKLDSIEDALESSEKNALVGNDKKDRPFEAIRPDRNRVKLNNSELVKALELLEDLVDDMEDAKTAEQKAEIQTLIDGIIGQHSELADYDLDYTSMTDSELESMERVFKSLKKQYLTYHRSGALSEESSFSDSELAAKLKELAEALEKAETDEERTAIKAQIRALVSSGALSVALPGGGNERSYVTTDEASSDVGGVSPIIEFEDIKSDNEL